MHTVEEALEVIVSHADRQAMRKVNLESARGLVLAERIQADADSPPFDKSMMDGFAVRSVDLPGGLGGLTRIGQVRAGERASQVVAAGQCIQIMTGAPIPKGADAVIMIERTKASGEAISFDDRSLQAGQNIMTRATEYAAGEFVLEPGHTIGPAEMGLLASVGVTRLSAYARPRIAILSTGDEIVPANEKPGPNQIRNSNEWTLRGAAERAGAEVVPLGLVRDDEAELRDRIREGLEADILLLSGGVSAGKRDLVPAALTDLDVIKHLHGIEFKPGKPMWFGSRLGNLVFGLPGNPVSVLACFEVFVRTALRARQGVAEPRPVMIPMPLAIDVHYPTKRTTYHPARVSRGEAGLVVEPVAWKGSPDLRALSKANAFVVFPIGEGNHAQGTRLDVQLMDVPERLGGTVNSICQ